MLSRGIERTNLGNTPNSAFECVLFALARPGQLNGDRQVSSVLQKGEVMLPKNQFSNGSLTENLRKLRHSWKQIAYLKQSNNEATPGPYAIDLYALAIFQKLQNFVLSRLEPASSLSKSHSQVSESNFQQLQTLKEFLVDLEKYHKQCHQHFPTDANDDTNSQRIAQDYEDRKQSHGSFAPHLSQDTQEADPDSVIRNRSLSNDYFVIFFDTVRKFCSSYAPFRIWEARDLAKQAPTSSALHPGSATTGETPKFNSEADDSSTGSDGEEGVDTFTLHEEQVQLSSNSQDNLESNCVGRALNDSLQCAKKSKRDESEISQTRILSHQNDAKHEEEELYLMEKLQKPVDEVLATWATKGSCFHELIQRKISPATPNVWKSFCDEIRTLDPANSTAGTGRSFLLCFINESCGAEKQAALEEMIKKGCAKSEDKKLKFPSNYCVLSRLLWEIQELKPLKTLDQPLFALASIIESYLFQSFTTLNLENRTTTECITPGEIEELLSVLDSLIQKAGDITKVATNKPEWLSFNPETKALELKGDVDPQESVMIEYLQRLNLYGEYRGIATETQNTVPEPDSIDSKEGSSGGESSC